MSQITFSGPLCLSRNCSRKAVDVPELLFPSSSIHSTSPRLQAHRRIVAGLLSVARAGRVHQGWLSPQHPLAPQLGVRTEVGLIGEKFPLPGLLSLECQGGVLRHEGLPFFRISLEQTPLGALEREPHPVQVLQASAPGKCSRQVLRLSETAKRSETNCRTTFLLSMPKGPVGQCYARRCRSLLDRSPQLRLLFLAEGGGEPPDSSKIRAAGPPSLKAVALLSLSKGADGVSIPFQRLRRGRGGQSPAQEPQSMPPPELAAGLSPGASVPGTSCCAHHPRPTAKAPSPVLSPSYPSPSPLSLLPLLKL